jgi:exosortase A-associated hydrolase 1
MNIEQRALRFNCQGSSLVGIIDVPERTLPRGVLLLADAAQYRVGGHRQFTLLSRALAARGIPVMRFDRRGMGDSEGAAGNADTLEEDIRAAMKEFFMQAPEMKEIVILGLGDGASAAAMYAGGDARVRGLVLLNPAVGPTLPESQAPRTAALARLLEVGFWKKVAAARLDGRAAAALRRPARATAQDDPAALPQRVAASLAAFGGQVLVVLGGAAPAGQHFARLMAHHQLGCRRVEIPGADHHFASREWRDEVATRSANWIMSW